MNFWTVKTGQIFQADFIFSEVYVRCGHVDKIVEQIFPTTPKFMKRRRHDCLSSFAKVQLPVILGWRPDHRYASWLDRKNNFV